MNLIWIIPLLPGLGAAINGLAGVRYFSRKTAGAVACATMVAALGLSLFACWQLLLLAPDARAYDVEIATWFPTIPLQTHDGIGSLRVPWGFRLDPLAAMMILVVTGIGALIHVYSTAYMADEPRGGVARFFCYLNLFCFFMLMLVLGNNFLVMFVGWEGVGLCSYLLIGYWYEKKSASDAGKKAFITNRIGDWGFILGIFLIFYTFGTFDFRAVQNAAAAMPIETSHFGVLSCICLFLFIGATGKSAQIPLYIWLPDAMEGPTPVSALIHAATMVTAGVYMVGRNAVLFSHAPQVMMIVAIVGVLTAFMAASIGLVQYDIKRVLAYSTVSQLGYMFTAMGVGAFAAGTFHLMTHAFFKALLFLGSGSVIHAMAGEQDMRRMGGLKKYLPVTYATMLIGMLAIAGIAPFAGFFSKDEILFRAFLANKPIWVIAVATALMTAFYMARLIYMTFFGPYHGPAWETAGHAALAAPVDRAKDIRLAAKHGVPHPADAHAHGQAHRDDHEVTHGPAEPHARDAGHEHGHSYGSRGPTPAHGAAGAWHGPHESPTAMTFPLMVLAVGAMVAGFVGVPAVLSGGNAIEQFLEPSFVAHEVGIKPDTTVERGVRLPPSREASADRRSLGGGGQADQERHEPPSRAGLKARTTPPSESEHEAPHASPGVELGLMGLSLLIAVAGILLAHRFYVTSPEISDQLADRWAGAHQTLLNKYYVDELYDATVVSGTFASGRGLWAFDRRVVDGAVNGTGWLTIIGSWFSGLADTHLVDGVVNLVGRTCEEASFWFRRMQTGLVQNYALLMLFGIFAFVSIYLFVR